MECTDHADIYMNTDESTDVVVPVAPEATEAPEVVEETVAPEATEEAPATPAEEPAQ